MALRALCWIGLAFAAAVAAPASLAAGEPASVRHEVTLGELPAEARATLRLIEQGGPFPYKQDGAVFGNREHRLPPRQRGWYREYTVPTPGGGGRGAGRGKLRIVAGRDGLLYYSDDHYRSFRRIRERGKS